jgi:hypothetical protein
MALHCPLAVAVFLLPLVVASAATDFDFFHHVQQLESPLDCHCHHADEQIVLDIQYMHSILTVVTCLYSGPALTAKQTQMPPAASREARSRRRTSASTASGQSTPPCRPDPVNPNKTSCWHLAGLLQRHRSSGPVAGTYYTVPVHPQISSHSAPSAMAVV